MPKLKFKYFPLLLFSFTLIIMNFTTLASHDLGWHLKTGEWIFHHLQIPTHDLYASRATSHPWIDLHWGFQILIYPFWALGGLLGLNGLKSILLLLVYGIMGSGLEISYFKEKCNISRPDPTVTTVTLMTLSSLASQERLVLRPELLTFLFLNLDLYLLESERLKSGNKIIWILLIQILWTNVEGLFMMGPGLILIYLLGEIWERKNIWKLSSIFILSLLVSLLNPYGLRGFLFPFTLFKKISLKGNLPFQSIGEFLSPFSPWVRGSSLYFFYFLLGGTLITCLFQFKKMPRSHLILATIFSILACLAQRNIALFAMVAPVIILKNLNFSPLRWKLLRPFSLIPYTLLCFTLILFSLSNRLYMRDGRLERFGLGMAPEVFPKPAIQYLLKTKKNIPGRIFNSLEWGPALIQEGWPQLSPLIDTRLEVYGPPLLHEYFMALRKSSQWKKVIYKYNVGCVLIDHIQQDSLRLITRLWKDPDWALVYVDEVAVIFFKNPSLKKSKWVDGRGQLFPIISPYPTLQKWLPFLPPEKIFPFESIYRGRFFLSIHQYQEAKKAYWETLKIFPECPEAWINLAFIEGKNKNISKAVSFLKEAIHYDPLSYQAYFNLGNLYLQTKKYSDAVKSFEKAIHIQSTLAAQNNLAIAKRLEGERNLIDN